MSDRGMLWLAQAFYLVSLLLTAQRLRRGEDLPVLQRLNYAVMALGFVAHTAFLYWRGMQVGRCPLTNPLEVSAFVGWAAVLFYLVVGGAYRVSFLGAFTAPVVLAINGLALLLPVDVPAPELATRSPWVEAHAALAIVAGGALALAAVAAGMYLWQEQQLKTRRLSRAFLLLPPLEQLDVIRFRLVVIGFALLTVGVVGGFVSYQAGGHWATVKIAWALSVWAVYGLMTLGQAGRLWRGRRMAWGALVAFVWLLTGFWGVNFW
ncbi:MAG: cytochrome c biogenesis protein CcsA [Verrucomicrobiae bacterium]|nr:cytochrome c biogenesis protein CcsA [Verrucomicrobiae bacterium]